MNRSILVVGGGVIGLSCAWRLAQSGHRVTVLDAAPEAREASWAAGGMLAPHHEAESTDDRWRLGVAGLARWTGFARELVGDPAALDFHAQGGLVPWLDDAERSALDPRMQALRAAGVAVETWSARTLAAQDPALAGAAGAFLLPAAQVDPRRLLTALRSAVVHLGVDLRPDQTVAAIAPGVVGLAGGMRLEADEVLLASGAWSQILARSAGLALPVEPVKGQMVRFGVPDGLLRRFVHCHHAYLIPRRGKGVVVGATMVESGFDKSEDAVAIARLADQARRLVPALIQAAIAETWTGLRPRLCGGRPLLARIHPGLIVATGHFRNGILLAPLTAEIVVALADQRAIPPEAVPFSRPAASPPLSTS